VKTASPQVRGIRVAKQLGWPSRSQGFWGATSGLLDPFAPYQRPRSSMILLHQYNRQSQLATMRRMNASARQLSKRS
jgi:hypothetical protein